MPGPTSARPADAHRRPAEPRFDHLSAKHTDTPEENAIVDQIIQGVLNEVCEYFDSDDEDCPA
ncbi:MAG TPA: hypothetical protein VFS43_23290 [Polyangiaceae bacterium]|nr:hypothetical protein [Polyangiaceae bacterium]